MTRSELDSLILSTLTETPLTLGEITRLLYQNTTLTEEDGDKFWTLGYDFRHNLCQLVKRGLVDRHDHGRFNLYSLTV